MPTLSLREAEAMLLERRRAQRGSHTPGDDPERAYLAALALLPAAGAQDARASGRRLGEHVYSRRYVDADLPGAIAALSASLAASGAGSFLLAESFHRSATVRFVPGALLGPTDAHVRQGFAAGVLEGFLSAAFNCEAHVDASHGGSADEVRVRLGEGRNVNGKRRGVSA